MQLCSCPQSAPAGTSWSHLCSVAAQLLGWCKLPGHSLCSRTWRHTWCFWWTCKAWCWHGNSSAVGARDCREQSTGCQFLVHLDLCNVSAICRWSPLVPGIAVLTLVCKHNIFLWKFFEYFHPSCTDWSCWEHDMVHAPYVPWQWHEVQDTKRKMGFQLKWLCQSCWDELYLSALTKSRCEHGGVHVSETQWSTTMLASHQTPLLRKLINFFSLSLKTRARRSGQSCSTWTCNKLSVILGHLGFVVMVMKKSGLPYVHTYVIASICHSCIYRGPPVNVDSKMTCCPAFCRSPSLG